MVILERLPGKIKESKMDKKMKNGLVLLKDGSCDFENVIENLKKEWDITVEAQEKDGVLSFNVGNNIVLLSLVKSKVSDEVAESVARNLFWEDGKSEVSGHNAYVKIEIDGGKDAIKVAKLFVKIASAVLSLENAIGIYTGVTILGSEMYKEVANELKDDDLPLLNLVYFGFYQTDNGICGYTQGLDFFDKKEIEVVDTDVEFGDLFDFMVDVANYVITSDVKLGDGETIGFSAEQKLPITLSEGVSVEGMSLKIGLNKENIK